MRFPLHDASEILQATVPLTADVLITVSISAILKYIRIYADAEFEATLAKLTKYLR
ncbi:hypothetical protein [Candidatus Vallotiella sp. (ex Adelges kitamiensis)]|uniref:hypothetical protein n=1 Tax=Candidatus Vallotiella sp. (ex Adelges kitamiensis) TaxID=2864217 RepID=UPI001CE313FC|nr:hypothetical protein [Candidatus Vallotia sp. (ex Adelges kitamiensis)]